MVETSLLRVQFMAGEWDDALEGARAAALDLEQRGNLIGSQFLVGGVCEISIERGALDDATSLAASLVTPLASLRRDATYVRARLARSVGDLEMAEQLLAGERARAREGHSRWRLHEVLVELVEVLVELHRTDEAREVLDDLIEVASATQWAESATLVLRARTVLGGDPELARQYIEAAASEGWEVERAHARLLLGELDVDPGANLTEAYRMFDAFGAVPRRRRAAAGLRSRGLTVPRRVAARKSDLTETETQLVRLVCEGLSNRQIATALHYSTKTIEVYLSRLYAKTGCASRLALIRAVDSGAIAVD